MQAVRPLGHRKILRSLVEAAAVVALLAALRAYQLRGVASGSSPPLAGRDLHGQRLSLDDFRDEAVAVHFWATWCEVCSVESGSVESLARSGKVLTVATSSGDAAAVEAYMRKAGLDFPVVVDEGGAIAAAWGVSRFPTTFFLTRDRRVRTVESGYTTSLGLRARLAWAGL